MSNRIASDEFVAACLAADGDLEKLYTLLKGQVTRAAIRARVKGWRKKGVNIPELRGNRGMQPLNVSALNALIQAKLNAAETAETADQE